MTNVYELDGTALHERAAAHAYLQRTLGFPGWYGGNLDALYDMLTAFGTPTMIWITDADAADPALAQVFEDAMAENQMLTVIFESDA